MTEPDILTPREACGCGAALAVIVGLAAFLLFGCAPRYTVVAADREAIPVKQTGDSPRAYVEATEDATGWYIPDATLIDLLEAD